MTTRKLTRNDVVLVVDDSPDALGLVNETLEQAGFNVLVALEGKQALTIARRISPDLILLDALMPHMDGFETCRELKKIPELAATPVIFMTGLTDKQSVVQGLEAGGVDYLTKPIHPHELLARMNVHLSNARLTSSAHSALDSTGQYLFSVDLQGRMLWATPQTHALLARARANNEWRQIQLPNQLQNWLQRQHDPGHVLSLNGLDSALSIRFLQRLEGEEVLLRLEEAQQQSGEVQLREELGLTLRESEVLFWISNGKTNREIGEILAMSPRTVNKHLEQIFPKLGVENRTAAARIALQILTRS